MGEDEVKGVERFFTSFRMTHRSVGELLAAPENKSGRAMLAPTVILSATKDLSRNLQRDSSFRSE